jgi:flagellar L-ring protein precursor FlgH
MINDEVHKMSIAGIVRENDIDGKNQVLSYRIANAEISYQKLGGIRNKKPNKGILKKIVFVGIGVGIAAAAILASNKKN